MLKVTNYTYDMFVGVCWPDHSLNVYLGNTMDSWALSLASGKAGHGDVW